ncbi:hypothetical protein [Laceyella putida]|uniref:Uncharacterized protein n=1 Tax=Laceyella putida TaxID=110101 RepID=A0ABW2RR77_9BACL
MNVWKATMKITHVGTHDRDDIEEFIIAETEAQAKHVANGLASLKDHEGYYVDDVKVKFLGQAHIA